MAANENKNKYSQRREGITAAQAARLEKVLSSAAKMPHVVLGIANIRHDSWCEMFKTGRCNCNPEIELEEVK